MRRRPPASDGQEHANRRDCLARRSRRRRLVEVNGWSSPQLPPAAASTPAASLRRSYERIMTILVNARWPEARRHHLTGHRDQERKYPICTGTVSSARSVGGAQSGDSEAAQISP
jgi:hypothetical protein